MKILSLFLIFLMTLQVSFGQKVEYHILEGTGKVNNKLPVLTYLDQKDPRYNTAVGLFENTFISRSNYLYSLIQQYLVNKGEKKSVEPAFLYLSNHQGGFPKQGFYLEKGDSLLDRYKTYYIDLPDIDKNPATLNSITQIYPHELAHVFFALLAPRSQDNYKAFSSDMHYFSVMTNYLTAFNEGFAEHFENASRLFEPDKQIRKGTADHTVQLEKNILPYADRLDRDFRHPLRLGFYRSTMLFWYQKFENLKRYKWAIGEDFSHSNKRLSSGNAEKAIQYRNSGLGFDPLVKRTQAQAFSTEGIINAYFTRLLQSELKNNYMPSEFYYAFLSSDSAGFDPRSIDPVINHYLKIFRALNEQMNHEPGDTSFIQLFITVYGRLFPAEKNVAERIWQEVTGQKYSASPVPEIWLVKKDHVHNYMLLDQFDGTTIPYYSFNINTADESDLSVFDELSGQEINAILNHRDKTGGFRNIMEIKNVPGLSSRNAEILLKAHENISSLKDESESSGINIFRIFLLNPGQVFLKGFIWFIVFILAFYALYLHSRYPVKAVMIISLGKLLKFFLMILAALAMVIFSKMPLLVFSCFLPVVLIIDFIRTRKNYRKLAEVLVTSLVFGSIIIYSLF